MFAALAAGLTFATGANAGANCNVTAVNVNFGAYDPTLGSADDSTGTVTVTCNYVAPGATRVSYTVALSNGANSTTPATRRMAAGSSRLNYNLFQNSSRSQIWANGSNGTVIASGSLTVGPGGSSTRTRTHTVYGRVPSLQEVVPGTYNDTIVVTLTY